MCDLKALAKICGNKIPGTKDVFYVIPIAEVTTFPDVLSTTGAGDSKRLDGPFVLSTVEGEGYWRAIPIRVDSGNLRTPLEGERGGKMTKQFFDFAIEGFGAVQKEWFDELLCSDGCFIALVPDKAGNYHVMGDLTAGVYVESGDGGTGGATAGKTYSLYANTGYEPYEYDADTDGIDTTPSPAP